MAAASSSPCHLSRLCRSSAIRCKLGLPDAPKSLGCHKWMRMNLFRVLMGPGESNYTTYHSTVDNTQLEKYKKKIVKLRNSIWWKYSCREEMEVKDRTIIKYVLWYKRTQPLLQFCPGLCPRVNWEIGIDIYTLLCIKLLTKKDLLYSTENCTQYSVMVYVGKESKKERIYVYI